MGESTPQAAEPAAGLPIGQLLLRSAWINEQQLADALAVQKREGERLGVTLVSLGYINRLTLARALSEQTNIPYHNVLQDPPPIDLVQLLDEQSALRLGAVVIAQDADTFTVGFADPTNVKDQREVETLLQRPINLRVISELDLQWILDLAYRQKRIYQSVSGLLSRTPDDSAAHVPSDAQLLVAYGIISLVALGLVISPQQTLVLTNGILTAVYFAIILYRAMVTWRGLAEIRRAVDAAHSPADTERIPDSELPVYTVLVPLFREEPILPALFQGIADLDYPHSKLDVKILLEESDPGTLAAAKALQPPGYFKFIVVPDCEPRTKPKACNYGLIQAEGEYCVIYDGEDEPDRNQLRRAVGVFRQAPPQVVCLQAQLNCYNAEQNLLTRWYTAEYSMWFDVFLPGLMSSGSPIPLGGTSNHFVTEKLRQLGAWDPHNVTEDIDLGMRLHKLGYVTQMLPRDSVTLEEATSHLPNWIRQRSRWIKGYAQTYLVPMRNPLRLFRELGLRDFMAFQAIVGGTPFTLMVNPWYWFVAVLWLVTKWDVIQLSFPGALYYLSVIALVVGNLYFVYAQMAATYARFYYQLVLYSFISPIYWFFMSIAAWRGMLQLINRPSFWEKTHHGMATRQRPQKTGEKQS